MSFTKWLNDNWKGNNMFPPALESGKAIDFLVEYLLGENWYTVNPLTATQANVEIVDAILTKYSRKYRKEKREYEKHITK